MPLSKASVELIMLQIQDNAFGVVGIKIYLYILKEFLLLFYRVRNKL